MVFFSENFGGQMGMGAQMMGGQMGGMGGQMGGAGISLPGMNNFGEFASASDHNNQLTSSKKWKSSKPLPP